MRLTNVIASASEAIQNKKAGLPCQAIARLAMTLLCTLLLTQSANAQDYTSNLVGHWTMDDTNGSTITDSSSSGNNGTWDDNDNDDTTEETSNGVVDNALTFDGIDDYISIPDAAAIDLQDTVTLSFWIKASPQTSSPWAGILRKSNNTGSPGYYVSARSSTADLQFRVDVTGGNNQYVSINNVLDETWHHVVAILDSGSRRAYLDGEEVVNDTYTHLLGFQQSGVAIEIAKNNANYLKGTLDDIRVYDRALTAADVSALYEATRQCKNPTSLSGTLYFNDDIKTMQYCNSRNWVAIGAPPVSDTGLVGHWKLDETSGATITDYGSGGNNGTWSDSADNDVTDETGAGQVNEALTFDGSDDIIDLSDNLDSVFANSYTVCAWAKPTNSTSGYVIGKYDSATTDGFFFRVVSGTDWAIGNGDVLTEQVRVASSVDADTWQHICGVINIAPGTSTMYKNGASIGTVTTVPAAADNARALTIGNRYDSARDWEGELDDIRIYNRALSASEVANLYAAATPSCGAPSAGLVGHWKLDETTGNSITDSSSTGANGTWGDGDDSNVTGETVAGKDGTALQFDGVNDIINIGTPYDLRGYDEISFSAWVKFSASKPYGTFLYQRGPQFSFAVHSSGLMQAELNNDDGWHWIYSSGVTFADWDQWHHVAGVLRNGQLHFYRDGVNVYTASTGSTGNGPIKGSGNDGVIIGKNSANTSYFDGTIDDVRIYNRALSDTEIAALYGATGGTCSGVEACANPYSLKGTMLFNTDVNAMQYCNGSNWVAMAQASDGGAGTCSNPSGVTAELRYNGDLNVLQYCEGDEWIAVSPQTASQLSLGLIAHWKLDETSGDTITDSSGNGNNGTWTDGADEDVSGETTVGPVGNSLTFDSTDDYINIGLPTELEVSDNITISSWIKTSNITKTEMSVFTEWAGLVDRNYSLFLDKGELTFGHGDSTGATYEKISSGSNIADDGWHHIVFTAEDLDYTFYIDSVSVDTGTLGFAIAPTPNSSTRRIGGHPSFPTTTLWDGNLDDVRVYDRALSASEVAEIYDDYHYKNPSLVLNFAGDDYTMEGTTYADFTSMPGVTVTRSSPATTYAEDSSGNLVAFAANEPRITDKGILIEEERENLALYSEEFDNAVYNKGKLISVVANTVNAPDGSLTADTLTATSGSGQHKIHQPDSSTNYVTVSTYVKKNTHRYVKIGFGGITNGFAATFDIEPGVGAKLAQGGLGTYTNIDFDIEELANGWYKIWASGTTIGTDGPAIAISHDGTDADFDNWMASGTESIYIWGFQYEDSASFPTSYIPTAGSTVTRDTDVAYISTGSWFNADEGTYYAAWNKFGGGNSRVLGFDDPTNTPIAHVASNAMQAFGSGVSVGNGTVPMNTLNKGASRYANGVGVAIVANASPTISTTANEHPTPTIIRIAPSQGTNYYDGYINSVRYYNKALTDAQLQAITAP